MRIFGCSSSMLLGLSLCVFRAWCVRVRVCKTPFNDTASSAYLADAVVEAEVIITDKVTLESNLETNNYYNVTIKVASRKRVYNIVKDQSGSVKSVLKKSRGRLTVGLFGPENLDACVTEIVKGRRYVFFLRTTTSPAYFSISAFPLSTSGSKKAARTIRKRLKSIVCDGCAKGPTINKRLKASYTVPEKKKVKLQCSGSGNPRPIYYWMKKDKVLGLRKVRGIKIRTGRKGTRLEMRRPSRRSSGQYVCVAENAVKRVEKVVTLKVMKKQVLSTRVPIVEKTTLQPVANRFVPCTENWNGYCLNGGNCTYSTELQRKFCRCLQEYSGKRCEYRDLFDIIGPIQMTAKLERDRTLIVIGIVIACLVFIVICIASYYLAKQKRDSYYKRREDRKNRDSLHEPYKPLLRDEVDGGMPKISMTTQTEESIFLMLEDRNHTEEDPPDSPTVRAMGNHVFRYFPKSSTPVHLREHSMDHPVDESPNTQRQRLQAVSTDASTVHASPSDGRDTPDAAENSKLLLEGGGSPPPLKSNISYDSCDSLPIIPTALSTPDATSTDNQDNGGADTSPSHHSSTNVVVDSDSSSESEAEEELTIKHPELMVHLHISEEDLSDHGSQNILPALENAEEQTGESIGETVADNPDQDGKELSSEESLTQEPFSGDMKCNGYEDVQGQNLYEEEEEEDEESTSEDSSNSSSSNESSLVDTETLPTILALENHHVKDADQQSNLSWDEHGTPVIPQYACNPYAHEMDDDIVNSPDLYRHDPTANFRPYESLADRPIPPPVGDKLKDVQEDQDPVLL